MQGRKILEENLLLGFFRRLIVDGLYFQQRKVALGILGRADQSRNRFAYDLAPLRTGPAAKSAVLS